MRRGKSKSEIVSQHLNFAELDDRNKWNNLSQRFFFVQWWNFFEMLLLVRMRKSRGINEVNFIS